MSSSKWIEIDNDISSAVLHFKMSVEIFEEQKFDEENLVGYTSKMALMHSMSAGYTSFENALKRIFNIMGEEIPVNDSWHSDLIKRAAKNLEDRPGIISETTYKLADELRRFRHIAVRTYDNFNAKESIKSVQAAKDFSQVIIEEIKQFKNIIDPEQKIEKSSGPK